MLGVIAGGAYALGRFRQPGASPSPTRPAVEYAPAASPNTASDPHAAKACQLNTEAYSADRLTEVPVVEEILAEATQGGIAEIRIEAQLLRDEQKLAIAAKGRDNEASRVIRLGTQSIRLRTVCVRSGLGG